MDAKTFNGDRPIQSQNEDLFGFATLAERIAASLTSQAANKGFVFGLEGKWGSGKSSLLALTLAQLREMNPAKVAAIEFRPWLIGDRDQLLTALFDEFAKAIAELQSARGETGEATKRAAGDVVEQVRSFARHLGPIGKLAGVAGLFVPGASAAGDMLEKIAAAASEQTDGPSLVAQKDRLASALLDLDCRIVVAIDDVDRLEPAEVAELLRLVRSVADFPNVSYLLCYDGLTLAHAIESGTGVSSGTAYLEKIVQTEVAVPRPESFALRRWFTKELETFMSCDAARVSSLQQVIDETGGRVLKNPRAVVRALDSLRVFWPSLAGRVDTPDLVWLRLIAVGSPNLFRWVEEYLVNFAAVSSGRSRVTDEEQIVLTHAMDAALEKDGLTWKALQFELDRHLPGIDLYNLGKDKDSRIFAQADRRLLAQAAIEKRLASPSHARIYFTLIAPADGVSESDISRLIEAAGRGRGEVAALLIELDGLKGDAGASKAERLLDQVRFTSHETVKTWPIENLIHGIVDAADEVAEDKSGLEWGRPHIWFLIEAVLKQMKVALAPARYDAALYAAFETGASIGFLTEIFRQETFGHGYYGDRADPHDRLISADGFEPVRMSMLKRYEALQLDGVVASPHATSMLYAWSQGGARVDLMQKVAARGSNETWLLQFLQLLYGPRSTLSRGGLETFFASPASVVRRVDALAKKGNRPAGRIIASLLVNSNADEDELENILTEWETPSSPSESSGQAEGKATDPEV
ncbi:KAP family P-loop NTPase fold protein [Agrobacterium tumefaciens]|uniref:KAP family P-loop NTPase fold protein n=1 Tax=Agrobacterium tumefaciens TaxID=358 RepID=UPI001573C626|nr:NTPase KAP [Agrobacterium tumefaciens]